MKPFKMNASFSKRATLNEYENRKNNINYYNSKNVLQLGGRHLSKNTNIVVILRIVLK